jgi:hypothetical protein
LNEICHPHAEVHHAAMDFHASFLFISSAGHVRVVLFWQSNFPTQDSKPISQESLTQALDGLSGPRIFGPLLRLVSGQIWYPKKGDSP